MIRRPWTRLHFVVVSAAGFAVAGCDGSSTPVVDTGASERPMTGTVDGGPRPDGAVSPDGPTFEALPDKAPPPPPNAEAKTLVSGRARLVGTHLSACSNGLPTAGIDRWCAFTQPNQMIGRTDLWVMNMTKALAGTIPKCDGTDAACKLITNNLWTGQPMNGPGHPTAHRFDGDTLIYHANASTALDPYAGPIYAWRPDWAAPKQISGSKAYTCSAHFAADAYVCIENLSTDQTMPLSFDLTAGKLSTATPSILQPKIFPTRPNTQSSQWRVAFTRAGDYITWSTGGGTVAQRETVYISRMDDIADPAKRITTIATGVSRWSISADSKKIYYLRDYNYSTVGDPQGTMMMADFPAGTGETMLLAQKVGAFQVLADGEVDKGLGFFDNVQAGKASYKIMADRANPAGLVTVANNLSGVLGITRDIKYLYYFKEIEQNNGTTDGYIAKTDGSDAATGGCTLTQNVFSDQFGSPFTPNGSMVMWADNIDPIDGVGEGWVANPAGCTMKRKWSDRVDFWFLFGNDGMIFSDEGEADSATLKYQLFPGGTSMGTPVTVQKQINRIFALTPAFETALFVITGAAVEKDGIFSYAKFPFKPGSADGGIGM
jgi:hypothetical protein